jgi:enoyl-CoA hydratase/carnithine racemase
MKAEGLVNELKHVHVSIENKVAKLVIDHPPANALSAAVLSDLRSATESMASDASVKAVVITGQGRFFVAGADINQLERIKDAAEGKALAENGQRVLDKIEQLQKPVICAVNGMALGGGCELAMACHIRIASDAAKFGQPEINLGIIPGFGGTQRLARIIGPSVATELILTGDVISAQDALRLGLVNAVVPAADLEQAALKLAEKIASKSLPAIQAALRAIGGGLDLYLADGLALEAKIFGEVCETADKKEGLRAFLEKRKPNFQDR